MIQLSDYIDQEIVLAIPFIHPTTFQKVKLLGVEAGGIWIESQTLINMVLKATETATALRTLAFFFPYHELKFGFVGIEGPALNEEAFGV
jgi:poly(3-hydroxyalkanoate) synthetase